MTPAWWTSRSPSEQRLLGFGLLVVVAAVWFLLLVEPLQQERTRLQRRLGAGYALQTELHTMSREAARLRASADLRRRYTDSRALLSVVNATAAKAGTQGMTRRISPLDNDSVAMTLEDLPFPQLAQWLIDLDTQYGIEVQRAVFDRAESGLVNARLTLGKR